ncbi:periplasmic chaperone for outer membrane proteins SurA [Pseudooceanicola antarcticus]|nr:peptidylprolyl isomerase [Pseudooceanicola antarcticus]SNY52357.1 periplasmic chaperone for outer membrane proteins SurA [Pseudooceanicola antarcticus]
MTRSHSQGPRPRRASRRLSRLLSPLAACLALMGTALPAAAQSFGPAIRVNDKVITEYELDQRARLLQVFNAPGDTAELAREQLIEDRLKAGAAERFGLAANPEDVRTSMEQFASQANLPLEQFVAALEQEGIAAQTYRDFIASNVVWRQVVRGLFAGKVNVSEEEIDRAIASQAREGGVQVLLSEIFIPTAQNPQAAGDLARQISQLTSIDDFAAAARQYSAAPSRDEGGRISWMSISNLPPALQPVIMGLRPGEVTAPQQVNGAFALFQLRAIQESGAARQEYSAIEYARYFIPGGRSPEALAKAAEIEAQIDTCDDLYGLALGQPEEVLARDTLTPAEVPSDIALELAKLDDNEVSTALTANNGQTLVFLMLCGRTPGGVAEGEIDRGAVLQQLQNRRLGSYAEGYLAQLRSEARIVE